MSKNEEEMEKLKEFLVLEYKNNHKIPVVNFRRPRGKGIFFCSAGKDRMAVTPGEDIWGCFLFPDCFQGKEESPEFEEFYFGALDDFMRDYKNIYPRIASHYERLSMDHFSTPSIPCFLCPEIEQCAVCPVSASLSGLPMGKIPGYICEIQKIKIRVRNEFLKSTL